MLGRQVEVDEGAARGVVIAVGRIERLDAGEPVTIPSLPDISDWESFEKARQTLVPNVSRRVPADRYRG